MSGRKCMTDCLGSKSSPVGYHRRPDPGHPRPGTRWRDRKAVAGRVKCRTAPGTQLTSEFIANPILKPESKMIKLKNNLA